MKCPPHIADHNTYPNQYLVNLTKDDQIATDVFHVEKKCKVCHLPVIILSTNLLRIIDKDKWEVEVHEVHGS